MSERMSTEERQACIERLETAQTLIRETVDAAGRHLRARAIWNEETRKYEPREEMIAMHDLINDGLVAWNRVKQMREALDTGARERVVLHLPSHSLSPEADMKIHEILAVFVISAALCGMWQLIFRVLGV